MRIDMKPQISVVVTCYNYGNFVAECLDSLQKQTFSDFEVIVVDDGSTDKSAEQIYPYLKDRRFRYIKQKNGGQANAKNRGIKESKAELIAFLDADDQWEPKKLEKQIPLFSRQEVGVVYSRASHIDAEGRPLPMVSPGRYLQPRRGRVTDFLLMDNFVSFSSSVVRRSCIEQFDGFNESLKMGIDWDLWLRISTKYQFDFVDLPLLIYRMGHAGQMSKNLEERQRCSDKIMHTFLMRFPEYVKKAVLRRAWAYTYMNRGEYHAKRNFSVALHYYYRSFLEWPISLKPIWGATKVIGKKIL